MWCKKIRNTALSYSVKVFRYLEPFRRDSRVWQTDKQTDTFC